MSKKDVALDFSVSQNFLTSRRVIARLLGCARLEKSDTVLEIGAGKGHLTRELAKRCAFVKAYEIDPRLCRALRARGLLPENARLYEGDFLRARLPKTTYKVFSNLPFCITSAVVRKLAAADNPPEAAWLLMERGAAMRFAGLPRENKRSLALKPFFSVRIACGVSREAFHPIPGVDCALLELKRKSKPDLSPADRRGFESFVAQAQKRGLLSLLTKRQVCTALKAAGLKEIPASGDLLYVQWLCLYRCYAAARR